MMKNNLEHFFDENHGNFDIEEPSIGHFNRFEQKLDKKNQSKKEAFSFKWLSIAASIVLIFGYWLGSNFSQKGMELGAVSPKMEETQNYFTTVIEREIKKVELQKNADNQKLIDDAFEQLNKLEENYTKLTIELMESNEDKRVIFAMINNFQRRIEVLQSLLNQIDTIKNTNYEISNI